MNFLKNLNIAKRLSWLQALLVAGLGFIAVTFIIETSLRAGLDAELETLNSFSIETGNAKSELLQLRRHEKNFLDRLDASYIDDHHNEYQRLLESLEQLNQFATTDEKRNLVKNAREFSTLYEDAFDITAQTEIDLGLDQDSGLHGKMRSAVHEVEDALVQFNDLRLDLSLLTMRRHEKDYIQREDPKYIKSLADEHSHFSQLLTSSPASSGLKSNVQALIDGYLQSFNEFVAGKERVSSTILLLQDAAHNAEPLFDEMFDSSVALQAEAVEAAHSETRILNFIFYFILVVIAAATAYSLYRVSRTIGTSLGLLDNTVKEISNGNYEARTNLESKDEIGEFSRTFDTLLDERVSTLAKAESENEKLNNSIIELMETVFLLSDKDLTVRVKVAEDVTGPVADSLNLMAEETAKVLQNIKTIAHDVENSASSVQNQGGLVSDFADKEREMVTQTMAKLEESAKTMTNIAKVAQSCNAIASRTSQSTQDALHSVTDTENGMSGIRETISETEKRIKRLAERSQEITSIVEIINNISERTHVLALNASMQAAAAGEAGRGFAVVADEVQRLAESSRQSTSEIATLVKNIQAETAEVMTTMNEAIGQVVDGTQLAHKSAEQMMATQKTAEELSSAVAQIARHSTTQAKSSTDLLHDASQIIESTEKTGAELNNQSEQTAHLVAYSQQLLESVQVFRLAQ